MIRPRWRIIIIVVLVIGLFLPGCSKKDSAAKKPETSSQQKVPPEVMSILSDLEKIIAGIGKKIEGENKPVLKESSGQSEPGQSQSAESQGGQDKQSGQDQSKQGGNQDQAGKQSSDSSDAQSKMNSWEEEGKSLKNIHRDWNTLEPEAVKAGLSITERDSFEQALDKITIEISGQKKVSSLMAAIELYGQYAKMVKVFKTPIPADFYQTKYEIMAASAEAATKEWTKAQERIPNIQKYWNSFKVQAQVKDEKLMSRTEFSIDDLVQAVNSKQIDTLIIKAEIAMSNLQALEKDLSSKKSSQ